MTLRQSENLDRLLVTVATARSWNLRYCRNQALHAQPTVNGALILAKKNSNDLPSQPDGGEAKRSIGIDGISSTLSLRCRAGED